MKIYCSGIGGIGLSAYASLQRHAGHQVSGSDRAESALLNDLRSQGISIFLDQSGKSVPADADLFVYSEAIPADAPERVRAAELRITQHSYPQALGELSKNHKVIAVCGTHGKSSTTAMCARMLMEAGMDPTVVVGTKLHELNGRNWRAGKSDIFLLEACEYRLSFFQYSPSIILLTTCDGDHFDYFQSMDDYRNAFVEFIKRLPENGALITHMGDPDCKVVADAGGRIVKDADAEPLLALKTPGKHMQQNSQLALSLAKVLRIDPTAAQKAVAGFAGSWRRMELKGTTVHGIPVIDDYGHHPREMRATIEAMQERYPAQRLVIVFQPHTHDRTFKMYEEFTKVFAGTDLVVIPNVYDARHDIEKDSVDVPKLVADIEKRSGVRAIHGKSLSETERLLTKEILQPGDVLLCMGAGDITDLASAMVMSS